MTLKQPKKKTFHDGHRKLWDDLARSGLDDKKSSKIWKDPAYKHLMIQMVLRHHCFCCHVKKACDCSLCPIRWQKTKRAGFYNCLEPGSPFTKWINCKTVRGRKVLAAKIRDLPWIEKTQYD